MEENNYEYTIPNISKNPGIPFGIAPALVAQPPKNVFPITTTYYPTTAATSTSVHQFPAKTPGPYDFSHSRSASYNNSNYRPPLDELPSTPKAIQMAKNAAAAPMLPLPFYLPPSASKNAGNNHNGMGMKSRRRHRRSSRKLRTRRTRH